MGNGELVKQCRALIFSIINYQTNTIYCHSYPTTFSGQTNNFQTIFKQKAGQGAIYAPAFSNKTNKRNLCAEKVKAAVTHIKH